VKVNKQLSYTSPKIDSITGKALVISCGVFSAIGGFLFGYDSGIISSTIEFIEYFDSPSNSAVGGIVSAFQGENILLASSTRPLPTGTETYNSPRWCCSWRSLCYLSRRKLGRKGMIFLGSLFAVFGCALQGGAATMACLLPVVSSLESP